MSSDLYSELYGIKGLPTAVKCSLISSPEKRRLLLWLQHESLKSGGLGRITEALVAAFPENVGTETMHSRKLKPGKRLCGDWFAEISDECEAFTQDRLKWSMFGCEGQAKRQGWMKYAGEEYDASDAVDLCRDTLRARLPDYLVELCVNPYVLVESENEQSPDYRRHAAAAVDEQEGTARFQIAGVTCFDGLIPSLIKLMHLECENSRRDHALTSLGRVIWETLDFCLETGRMVLIEAESGRGKSEAIKAWVAAHAGQALYVPVHDKTTEGNYYHEVARLVNVGASLGHSGAKKQIRVAEYLKRTKLMLVVDQAHSLLPSTIRPKAFPALLEWHYSGIGDHGVPVALAATPVFSSQAALVRSKTGWNSVPFFRRVKRCPPLPARLPKGDVEIVARKLLPGALEGAITAAVEYAEPKEEQLDALVDLVDEAARIAVVGRIMAKDLRAAAKIVDERLGHLMAAMGRKPEAPSGSKSGDASQPQSPCSVTELRPQRGELKATGRGITPASGDAEEEFADAPALAG